MIAKDQIWTGRYRSGRHRVLWVSDCGEYARVIRVGGRAGRFVTARRLRRDYRLAA